MQLTYTNATAAIDFTSENMVTFTVIDRHENELRREQWYPNLTMNDYEDKAEACLRIWGSVSTAGLPFVEFEQLDETTFVAEVSPPFRW